MSTENVKAFLADAKAKPEIQAEVQRLKESGDVEIFATGIVSLGAENGHEFTKEDLIQASTEVPDEGLDAVAGGGAIRWDGSDHPSSQNRDRPSVWDKIKSWF
jgi:predicted ribosomally synthesized peptide with nif11-like leader